MKDMRELTREEIEEFGRPYQGPEGNFRLLLEVKEAERRYEQRFHEPVYPFYAEGGPLHLLYLIQEALRRDRAISWPEAPPDIVLETGG